MKNQRKKNLYTLCECGIFLALAIALSYLEIAIGVAGGSISFTMLPLLFIAYRHGGFWGIGSGFVFGILKPIISPSVFWGLPSMILDYVIAYAVIGIAGFIMKNRKLTEVGALIGCATRYVIHTISGVLLFAITEPTTIEGLGTYSNPIIYSLVYNATYMLPSSLGCIILIASLRPVLKRMDKSLNG